MLKQATGSDPLTARRPFERPFTFYPQFKLWLSTNSRPHVDDPSDAMWRRIHAVPFNAHFVKREDAPKSYEGPFVDTTLTDQLATELPGILAWAVRGCVDWHQGGLRPPQKVKDATKQYREEEDTLGSFLAECCEVDPNATVAYSKLFETYTSWCEKNGEQPEKTKFFGSMLSNRGFLPDRTHAEGRIRLGLRLKA